ncbi:taste receptor type 2 member 40-like [Alosa sapidissima]|uniref:taste receptor type 2 member 40-like n=1 Tax=Alosa sapidissima TaxID=34773 RepID=UPI001C093AFD|nr:taste receptor type 2 member 40-like [Alosa sapidissima]
MASGSDVSELAMMSMPLWAGVPLNIYNLLLTLLQLWRSRKAPVVNAVVCSISLSNVLLSLSCFLLMLLVSTSTMATRDGQMNPIFSAVLFLWLASCCVSFWSIAWLNVFYCVKVVSFSMECFGALKRNISSLVGAALLLTFVVSCLLLSPFLTLRLVIYRLNGTHATNASGPQNASYSAVIDFAPWINTTLYTATFICLLCPLPLMVMLPTSLRLVVHLCQHTLALRKNQTQCQSSASYLQVCKLTVSLVGVYITTLLIVSFFFISHLQGDKISYHIIMVGCTFYCMSTAGLLTASNRHLKDRLRCGPCWKDPSEPASKGQSRETVLT